MVCEQDPGDDLCKARYKASPVGVLHLRPSNDPPIYLPITHILTYNDDDDDVGSCRLPQQPNKRMIFEVLVLGILQAKKIYHVFNAV
jgi:hypothetical protein